MKQDPARDSVNAPTTATDAMDTPTEHLETEQSGRPLRADAARNRALILSAAEEIFATEGLAVPIDDVARRAGVGIGTLYRHFPTKEALFEAIAITRIERLLESARRYATSDDPGEALFTFLREFAREAAAKHDLMDALGRAGIDFKSRCTETIDETMGTIDVLMQRAVAQGAIRADLTVNDIVGLVIGTCHAGGPPGTDEAALHRLIGVVIDGLKPRTSAESGV